jgi:hypothetical protein
VFAARFLARLESAWTDAFAQQRTHQRAVELVVALLCAMGRRTISRALCAQGREQEDWSAAYRVFSRARWAADDLFRPVLAESLGHVSGPFVAVAFDDTSTSKTGSQIGNAFWQRDPLSPPFRYNLKFGQRFLVGTVLTPLHREHPLASARAIPVAFADAPMPRKPGSRATDEQRAEYERARKETQLSSVLVRELNRLRSEIDRCHRNDLVLMAVVDGSFCNHRLFGTVFDRVQVLARARRDTALCWPAEGPRRVYGIEKFTPEKIRADDSVPWTEITVTQSGQRWPVQAKDVLGVLWRRGARRRPLRLIVLAPRKYHVRGRLRERQPGYLLTTDLTTDLAILVQTYVDRWQIEVVHRELKDTLGLGQAQVRASQAVARQPAMIAAAYAMLQLTALDLWGPERTSDLAALPRWRRRSLRPSCQELIVLLRREIAETSKMRAPVAAAPLLRRLVLSGAA